MLEKLSRYYQEWIIALWNGGTNVSAIVQTVPNEGRITTPATICHWIFRWDCVTGNIHITSLDLIYILIH